MNPIGKNGRTIDFGYKNFPAWKFYTNYGKSATPQDADALNTYLKLSQTAITNWVCGTAEPDYDYWKHFIYTTNKGEKFHIYHDNEFNWLTDYNIGSEVEYTRQFDSDKWESLFVPFTTDRDQWDDNLEIVELANIVKNGNEIALVWKSDIQKVRAGVPYLIKYKSDYILARLETYTFHNADLTMASHKEDQVFKYDDITVTLSGTYNKIDFEDVMEKNFYTLVDGVFQPNFNTVADDNTTTAPTKVSKVKDDVALNPNNIYMSISKGDNPYNINVHNYINEDGSLTSIENVTVDIPEINIVNDNFYYDLTGRRVANPEKGIYIHNGKKVLIK